MNQNNLLKMIFRMSKNETSLFYFFLESRDNLCFYSTLPFEKGQVWRDVVTHCTPELEGEFKNAIKHMSKTISYEVLTEEWV